GGGAPSPPPPGAGPPPPCRGAWRLGAASFKNSLSPPPPPRHIRYSRYSRYRAGFIGVFFGVVIRYSRPHIRYSRYSRPLKIGLCSGCSGCSASVGRRGRRDEIACPGVVKISTRVSLGPWPILAAYAEIL